MRKKRLKLGDIYEISLPNGLNAYGRLYKESTLAIYKKICLNIDELSEEEEYEFFVGVYTDLLKDGIWKVVGNAPFGSEDEAWPPPQSIKDPINGKYSLYIKGEIIPSTEDVCKNLERVAAWDRHHVVDRIMGIDIWNLD
ncbi:MAG: Imm26 family immunity protein [Peptostreptococcaceae bacterium]